MWNKFSLFIVVGQAALITVGLCVALVIPGLKIALTPRFEEVLGASIAFLPSSIAAWWLFRKIQPHYARREARAVAIAFAVFMPMSLVIALPLAQFPGGYAGLLGGTFGLVGALVGIVVMTTALSFLGCLLALWNSRRTQ